MRLQFCFNPFPGGDAVTEYAVRYRRSDVPPLEAGAPLDLHPSRPIPPGFATQLTWDNPWPFGDRAGVYMIYNEFRELLYIGKASMNSCLGARLSAHFGSWQELCVPRAEWLQPARYVINIAVPEEMPFEAPALEEFLIRKLQPPNNGCGK